MPMQYLPQFQHSRYPKRGEVQVFCGDRKIYMGKWRKDLHDRIISYAFRSDRTVTVKRAHDDQLLFSVKPTGRDAE